MGLLDNLKSAMSGGSTDGMLGSVMGMIGGNEGGLNGLIESFKSKGLGDLIGSWVGTGQNKAFTGDQVQQWLGDGKIKELADKHGVDVNTVKAKVSEYLPGLVDKLTPDGKVPEGDMLNKGLNALKGLL